jgi:DNA-directed RNA polymerase subunit RPC12/RpoP
MEGREMTVVKWKGRNKGKRLYKCIDCGTKSFMASYKFNIRLGDRCMNCGGRLEIVSENGVLEQREKRTASNAIRENKPNHICLTRFRKGLTA